MNPLNYDMVFLGLYIILKFQVNHYLHLALSLQLSGFKLLSNLDFNKI